jgi:hypothetical protein
MQVGMRQLLVFFAVGATAARVGAERFGAAGGVMLGIAAVDILGIGYGKSQRPCRAVAYQQLCVADASRVSNLRQMICCMCLAYNVFELHYIIYLIYKDTKVERYAKKKFLNTSVLTRTDGVKIWCRMVAGRIKKHVKSCLDGSE